MGDVFDPDIIDGDPVQFIGMVSNINFYFSPLVKTPGSNCNEKKLKPDIAWSDMEWSHSGNSYEILDLTLDHLCSENEHEAVTLPLAYNYESTIKSCQALGNGFLTPFVNPGNLSSIDFSQLYGQNYKVVLKETWAANSKSKF